MHQNSPARPSGAKSGFASSIPTNDRTNAVPLGLRAHLNPPKDTDEHPTPTDYILSKQ